jgi:hypothetical protein
MKTEESIDVIIRTKHMPLLKEWSESVLAEISYDEWIILAALKN